MFAGVLQDVCYGLRSMRANPGVTAVGVLTLALGIGANTTVFGILNEGLLRPVPRASDPGALVQLRRQFGGRDTDGFSHLGYLDYRDHARSFSGLMAYCDSGMNLSAASRPEEVPVGIVTGNYFQVLGIRAALGRLIGPEDDRIPGAHPVAVLSYALWKGRFGARADVAGRTITLNGFPFTVLGVSPDGFRGVELGSKLDLWIPLAMERQARPQFPALGDRLFTSLSVVGRLRPGIPLEQAQGELSVLAARFEEPDDGKRARVLVLSGIRLIPEWRGFLVGMLRVLVAMVGLVLLIACANVANLLLARAVARRREIAVRLAIGAGRARLARQWLTESILLALLGGVAGLAVALGGGELFRSFYSEVDYTIDPRVFGFALAISVFSGLLFGFAPALQCRREDVISSLKGGAPGRGDSRVRLRQMLVVSQVALSLVVMVVAGLFVRTLRNLQSMDPGFQRRSVFSVQFDFRVQGYSDARGKALYGELLARAAALPQVRSAALANTLPVGWVWDAEIEAEGSARGAGNAPRRVGNTVVSEKYFETFGIALLQGRGFGPADGEGAPKVAVVNETMARLLWPGEAAIGKRFRFRYRLGPRPLIEVVGIARDSKYGFLAEKPQPFLYLPFAQNYQPGMKLVVRSNGDVAGAMAVVRDQVLALDANLPFPTLLTMDRHIAETLANERMNATMIGVFGLLALFISAAGVYAVTSYAVARRTAEIGIRLALGARPADVFRMILRQTMSLTGAGLVIGALLALAVIPLIQADLFGVSPADPESLAGAALILVVVTLLAACVPARRALRIEPMAALRYE
ncbi:MAG: ABC transporter permease [Acidobacteria bacterium]|nr:ABC transporter permease [Acidobacteriota bacterium]